MTTLFVFSILCGALFCGIYAENILCVFPFPSTSRYAIYTALTDELARRGHSLTIVTSYPTIRNETFLQNVTQISLREVTNQPEYVTLQIDSSSFKTDELHRGLAELNDAQLKSPQLQKLMASKERFDLVLVEMYALSMYAFAEHFNTPLIAISSSDVSFLHSDVFGIASHPIVYGSAENIYWTSFFSRLRSVYDYIKLYHFHYRSEVSLHENLKKKHFPLISRSLLDIIKNTDMALINLNSLMIGLRSTTPAVKYFGFMHTQTVWKIPKDVESFLIRSDKGVIVFSSGVDESSDILNENELALLVEAFSKLPFNVLWKWEKDVVPVVANNSKIHYSKWYSMKDVLAHPSVKLLICNANERSIEDAVWNGVPIAEIVQTGHRVPNSYKIETLVIGKQFNVEYSTSESLANLILNITTNITYSINAKKLSEIVRDQPVASVKRAALWIEHIARHGGQKHWGPTGIQVPLYQHYFLDIITFLFVVLSLTIYVLIISIRIGLKKAGLKSKKKAKFY